MPASTWMRGNGVRNPRQADLLRVILKRVSRSFYLSLTVLPKTLRRQMGLAYLFCRVADTIADTPVLPFHERLPALHTFRAQFQSQTPSRNEIARLMRGIADPFPQGFEEERQLLLRLQDCFDLYDRLSPGDQRLVSDLVVTLSHGMEMDLASFPGDTPEHIQALPDRASLERYTYYVAGVVGEFWTLLCDANLHAFRNPATLRQRMELARRFGQGLQLTNVLKDLGKDLQSGRCYLPADELLDLGLHAGDLLDPAVFPRIRPLIVSLIQHAVEHLDHGMRYVQLLPRRALRVRLSCMWPLLFAVQTLEEVCRSETLLCGRVRVKISRQAVYRTMLGSLWYLAIPTGFLHQYARLRQRLMRAVSLSPL